MKKTSTIIIVLFISAFINAQDIKYGKNGFSFNGGLSVYGPEVTLGNYIDDSYGELYFAYHLFDWEKDEKLTNKPTSGGAILGFNFIFQQNSDNPLKLLIGIGAVINKERLGDEAIHYSGEPTTGTLKQYEMHGGLRYFFSKQIFATAWAGYVFSYDYKDGMLNKYDFYGTTYKRPTVALDISVLYQF